MFRRVRKNRKKDQVRRPFESLRRGLGLAAKTVLGAMITAGMGLMFIVCHDFVTQCDYFKAEAIIIEGGSRLTRDEILDASEIDEGVNVFAMNLARIREKLEAHPWIAEAEVYRDPLKKIRMRIREQRPIAVIDLGRRFLMNEDGDIFMEALEVKSGSMPVVTGVDYADWRRENAPETRVFAAVMEILAMDGSGTSVFADNLVREIKVDRDIGLTLCIEGPVNAMRIGYGDYPLKEKRAANILSYIHHHAHDMPAIADLDLQNPDFTVARIKRDGIEPVALTTGPGDNKGGLR